LFLCFDGVFCNSTVYADGIEVGGRRYGWLSFSCDITDQARGKEAVTIAVKVDNSIQPAARWYTGSGIYSHVWLLSTDYLHVAENGIYITTPSACGQAPDGRVNIETTVQNDGTSAASFIVRSSIFLKADNAKVAQTESDTFSVNAGEILSLKQSTKVDSPLLWSVKSPNLYYVKTEIVSNENVVDDLITQFGFRSVSYDADGLYINGENTKLKGVANHWAIGALGAALPENIIRYTIQIYQENALFF
jgi:beta-galactosidase